MEKADHQGTTGLAHAGPAVAATVLAPSMPITSATVVQIEKPKASSSDASGLIPAWLALVGVIVTIIGKWFSEKLQRKYELRRQIYLDLIDATFVANACIGRICDASIPLSEITRAYQDTSPAIAKAEVTAPKRLSQALTLYKNAVGAAFMKLIAMRVAVEGLKAESAYADIGIAQFEAERRVFLEEKRRMIIEGVDDQGRTDRIQRHYDIFSAELSALYEKKKQCAASMQEKIRAMSDVALDEMKLLARLSPEVLKHVRRGLGFWSFNVKDFSRRIEGTIDMVDEGLQDVKSGVDDLIKRG